MRPAGMELWQGRRRRVRALHRSGGVSAATLHGAALIAWLVMPVPALAQDNVVATATLPRDLSPWGMYLNADPVVKAVLIGLAAASIVTWTVWLAKTIETTRTFLRDTRAREAQADKFFKECIEIAGAATQENCNVARLRVDTRKWAAARLAPKKYSDHITHDVKGRGINFQPQILIQCSRDEGEGIH